MLQVRSCLAGSSASEQLQAGDMLLAVSGTPVSSFPALDSLLEDLTAATAALGAPLPNGVSDTAQVPSHHPWAVLALFPRMACNTPAHPCKCAHSSSWSSWQGCKSLTDQCMCHHPGCCGACPGREE